VKVDWSSGLFVTVSKGKIFWIFSILKPSCVLTSTLRFRCVSFRVSRKGLFLFDQNYFQNFRRLCSRIDLGSQVCTKCKPGFFLDLSCILLYSTSYVRGELKRVFERKAGARRREAWSGNFLPQGHFCFCKQKQVAQEKIFVTGLNFTLIL